MARENSKFGLTTYVPILKCKQGELGALEWQDSRDNLVPLLEVREPDDGARKISGAWSNPNHVVMVNPLNVDNFDETEWAQLVGSLYGQLRAYGVSFVPVVLMDESGSVVAEASRANQSDGRGVCIRVDAESLVLLSADEVDSKFGQLLADLGVEKMNADLVIDGGLLRDSISLRVALVEAALAVIPSILEWRNIIVSYSAFPESVGQVAARGVVTPVSRDDALAFATLRERWTMRGLVFGDYAIGNPFYAEIPWAPIPAIRYASGESWMVHRGVSTDDRNTQYVDLSRGVVNSPYFAGRNASRGDAYLGDVASGLAGPGNPMTYVRAATSRHFACVLDRLATLGVP